VTKCSRNGVFTGLRRQFRIFGNNALHHFAHVSGYLQSSMVSRRAQVCRCLGEGKQKASDVGLESGSAADRPGRARTWDARAESTRAAAIQAEGARCG
jgi:hypothetical protein